MKFFHVLRAILREVFEEAAYERFCTRKKVEAGRESYADFVKETTEARNRKVVRCC